MKTRFYTWLRRCVFYARQALWPPYSFTLDGSMLAPMEIIYFTLAAILLYLAADWILRRIETATGKQLQYRNLLFFVILMTMAVTSFTLIRTLTGQ